MNTASIMRRLIPNGGLWPSAVGLTVLAVAAIATTVDRSLLAEALGVAAGEPAEVLVALGAFGFAFALRALSWKLVLPAVSFGQSLAAIHVALGANHILPFRLGEPLRVVSVTKRSAVPADIATASTITLRSADLLTVVGVGLLVAPSAFIELVGSFAWVLFGGLTFLAGFGWLWLRHLGERHRAGPTIVRPAGLPNVMLAAAAWISESVLVWYAAHWAGLDVSWNQAVLVTTVAVASQVVAFAPGGLGTYEAAAVGTYVALGFDAETALVAALVAHGLKTIYSLVAGFASVFAPRPALIGRFRLGAHRGLDLDLPDSALAASKGDPNASDARPILLFLPAHNEEASVVDVVRRVPREVLGHRVDVLVVDDGSDDDTAARARTAGAAVCSFEENRGLGAAVRFGLGEGVRRHAAVVAFCDADGEYGPEELESLVAPILAGEAEYVTGSRFLGQIDHMRPHRRIGNRVLTLCLSVVARRRISDGQSGYRALSPGAARSARIIHDFNYAQVLTLDLLAKGFRMREVPISYRFRTEGQSFVKLGPYLRRVVPGVYRQLNAKSATHLTPASRGAPTP